MSSTKNLAAKTTEAIAYLQSQIERPENKPKENN